MGLAVASPAIPPPTIKTRKTPGDAVWMAILA